MKIRPIILAGGSGTRLWPYSRGQIPKQFISLFKGDSLFKKTLDRFASNNYSSPIVISNFDHKFLVEEELKKAKFKDFSIILEPEGKNTAPAIALALNLLSKEEIAVVASSDHFISDINSFSRLIKSAADEADNGYLLTLGIKPTAANINYGYIEAEKISDKPEKIVSFHEKPKKSKAKELLKNSNFYWNAGIFIFKQKVLKEEFKNLSKDLSILFESHDIFEKQDSSNKSVYEVSSKKFELIQSIAFDYAIMEKTKLGKVIKADIEWNDVGSWSSIKELSNKNGSDSYLEGDITSVNSKRNYIKSDSNRLIMTLGIENTVIIDTTDALLIAKEDEIDLLKEGIERLKKDNRKELVNHKEVRRPWGSYLSVDESSNHQVKRIKVNPKQKLSVQKHFKRAEHWVVVSGTAEVTLNEDTFILKENESVFIPKESIHSLSNPFEEMLEIIEVQYGSYLGEDDIVRFSDIYGRS